MNTISKPKFNFILLLITIVISISVYSEEDPNKNTKETIQNPLPSSSDTNKTEGTDPKTKKQEPKYNSPWKGNIPVDHLRTLLVTPEQMKDTQKSDLFWLDNLKLGVSLRPRFEARENPDFNKKTDDYSSFVGQNTQLWFLFDPSPYYAIKVTMQDSRLWGGSQTPQNAGNWTYGLSTGAGTTLTPATSTNTNIRNNTDIREAYIVFKKTDKLPVSVFVGRQVFAFGDLKIVGPLNWLHTGFAFDGVRFVHDSQWFRSHVFGTILSNQYDAPYGLTTSNGRSKGSIDQAYFFGTYNTIKFGEEAHLDVYMFEVSKKWIPNTNPTDFDNRLKQRDDLLTTGFRFTNRTNNNLLPAGKIWDWTIESAWQSGMTGDRVKADWDILDQKAANGKNIYTEKVQYDTRLLSLDTGIKVNDWIRLGLGYTYASGDPNRSDSKVGTWQSLFPQIAGSFPNWNTMNGQALMAGFENIKSYSIRANLKTEYGMFIFAFYDTQKANLQDAWYKVSGVPNTGASTENYSNDKFSYDNSRLGRRLFYQYDFTWIYNYTDSVSIWMGISVVKAKEAIGNERTNPFASNPDNRYTFDDTSKFFYLMVSASL